MRKPASTPSVEVGVGSRFCIVYFKNGNVIKLWHNHRKLHHKSASIFFSDVPDENERHLFTKPLVTISLHNVCFIEWFNEEDKNESTNTPTL